MGAGVQQRMRRDAGQRRDGAVAGQGDGERARLEQRQQEPRRLGRVGDVREGRAQRRHDVALGVGRMPGVGRGQVQAGRSRARTTCAGTSSCPRCSPAGTQHLGDRAHREAVAGDVTHPHRIAGHVHVQRPDLLLELRPVEVGQHVRRGSRRWPAPGARRRTDRQRRSRRGRTARRSAAPRARRRRDPPARVAPLRRVRHERCPRRGPNPSSPQYGPAGESPSIDGLRHDTALATMPVADSAPSSCNGRAGVGTTEERCLALCAIP